MPSPLEKLIFETTQRARSLWYSAHYATAMRLAPRIDDLQTGRLPGWQAVYADLNELMRQDWRNVEEGLYPAPEPSSGSLAQQARRSAAFLRDLGAVNRRRLAANGSEIFEPELLRRYPRYYLQNFHYQSGGYLTPESAELYDHQVEVLFVGGADAMRRQALAALGRFQRSSPQREVRHLDIACGTGRFLELLKTAHPRWRVAGIDLSPPYLAEARKVTSAWSRRLIAQANAEDIPFADAAFDTASCVFLFHELPKKIRSRVAQEMFRVLKPGGRLFFLDSIQLGDRPDYDDLLERFPAAFHEPYYAEFIRADLPAVFEKAGFAIVSSERVFFAKLIVLEKPDSRRNRST